MPSVTAVTSHLAPFLPSPRSLTARLGMLWLMVAAILSHAALPTGSALQRGTGSAFSVTTSEVTTIPKRDKSRQRIEAEQAGDPAGTAASDMAAIAPAFSAETPVREPAGRIASVAAAPPDNLEHTLFQARAPPLHATLA